MKSPKSLMTLMTALTAFTTLSACAGQPLPNAAMSVRPRQFAMASAPRQAQPAPLTVDESSLNEDYATHYGFNHLNIIHRDEYGINQDSISLAYRPDHAVWFIWHSFRVNGSQPIHTRVSVDNKVEIQNLHDLLEGLHARNAQQKAHLALAAKLLQRNLDGMEP